MMNLGVIFSYFLLILSGSLVFLSGQFYLSSYTCMLELEIFSNINTFSFCYLLLLDWYSLLFVSLVSLISGVVMIYSMSYMMGDKSIFSFIILVFMFVVSMFLMVMSPNLLSILLGWDGLGLVSYGLVIYYNNWKSFSSGMLTVLSNRVGDLAIIICITWLMNFGSMNYLDLQYLFSTQTTSILILFLLVLASVTKSAQIPFSAWLPAAMAAPTPVSSLVHSSTLVTAGVYLLIRFQESLSLNYYLFLISCLTMIMSGGSAMFEMDFKKIIALSTLSQLGVMMMILSLGYKDLAFLHLLTHALFKSLLFLCAGFYIHSNNSWQDSRLFTNNFYCYPVFSMYFSVASLALCGFPFLAGFYSKDMILEYTFFIPNQIFLSIVIYLATMLTLLYSLRLLYYSFIMTSKEPHSQGAEDWVMAVPMILLFTMSIIGGSVLTWLYFPSVFIVLPQLMKILILLGLVIMFFMMSFFKRLKSSYLILSYFGQMWLLPLLSSSMMSFLMNKSLTLVKIFDQGWLELMGAQGVYNSITSYSVPSDKLNLTNTKLIIYSLLILLSLYILIFGMN